MIRSDPLGELIEKIDSATDAGRWTDVAAGLGRLADWLPARLELLARAILDLIEEGDVDLVSDFWSHLRGAIVAVETQTVRSRDSARLLLTPQA